MPKEMNFLIHSLPEESLEVDVIAKDETIWLNQKTRAELFDIDRRET